MSQSPRSVQQRTAQRIAVTGGIACGKSLVARSLKDLGVETLDADDIVHELIPADERRRLAAQVFADAKARKELEERIHPLVEARLEAWHRECTERGVMHAEIIPLLFEVGWEAKYDEIVCVVSEEATQIRRMMDTRGYSRSEAEARLRAQMPVREKAAKSHYQIFNEGTKDELEREVARFVASVSALP